MSKGLSQTLDALSLSKALLLLGELKLSEVDAVIPEHLRAVLADAQQAHQDIASAYATLLRLTLDALSARVAGDDPVLEKQLRMVTLRTTPPLLAAELKSLQEYMKVVFSKAASLLSDKMTFICICHLPDIVST